MTFGAEPLVELAISIQFASVPRFSGTYAGLFWSEIRADFPLSDEQPFLESVVETFDQEPAAQVEVRFGAPPVRVRFISADGERLVQVQADRFIFNWRKQNDKAKYPRWDKIRGAFSEQFTKFQTFVAREGLGSIRPNLCELTYVSHISLPDPENAHAGLGEIFTAFRPGVVAQGTPLAFQDARFVFRFLIPGPDGKPVGRLHAAVEPAYRVSDRKPVLVLNLTGRGRPSRPDFDGVLEFLNRAHDHLVPAFAELITNRMHELWERTDG